MQAKVGKFTTLGPPTTEMPTAAMTPKKSGTSEQTEETPGTEKVHQQQRKRQHSTISQATSQTPAVNSRYAKSESISTRNNELTLKCTKKSKNR
jgi:hypothetical protein